MRPLLKNVRRKASFYTDVFPEYCSVFHTTWLGGDFLLVKGGVPVSSSKTRMPRDQMSARWSCDLLVMISGETYSGVPQNVQARSSPT